MFIEAFIPVSVFTFHNPTPAGCFGKAPNLNKLIDTISLQARHHWPEFRPNYRNR